MTDEDCLDGHCCPKCLETSEVVGMKWRGVYDGILIWFCYGCKHRWHRWKDPVMRAKAEPYLTKPMELA